VTHGGGVIRIEVWQDTSTGTCVRYNFAYVNGDMDALDNGRVVGFDDAHLCPGFMTRETRIYSVSSFPRRWEPGDNNNKGVGTLII
jgi:hypothetical protein